MRTQVVVAAALAAALATSSAPAVELRVTSVTYPEKKTVEIPFTRTAIAPTAAGMKAEVRFESGQAQIQLEWERMEPAVLFAGNITTYALWAVTPDGRPENLGEVAVRESKSGKGTFRTGQKDFGLMVTAEVLPGTLTPTELVLFQSGKSDPKSTAVNKDLSIPYRFPVAGLVRPGNPSIATLKFTPGGEPIELMQARAAIELADSMDAAKVDEKSMQNAKTQLAQAVNATKGNQKQVVVDYSRRAIESAGVAARLAYDKKVAEQQAEEDARRRAAEQARQRELEAARAQAGSAAAQAATAQAQAATAQAQAASAQAQAASAQAQAASAEAEKARMAAEVDRLKAEKDALRKGLEEAVGKTMAISQTARGLVVNMADITFDVNKSTLKRDAQISVAKISGILSLLQKLNLRVEGYTDASGKEDLNMKLSAERARSVNDFLVAQGIAPSRVTHAGYGPASPVAANDTAQGRARNRRVEIIIAEGTVEPTPGGMVAPERPATKPVTKPATKPAAKLVAKDAAK